MTTLNESRDLMKKLAGQSLNVTADLIQNYGKGFEGDVFELCIHATTNAAIASGSQPEDADKCKAKFLKTYSKMSKSEKEVSPTGIVGAFAKSLTPGMKETLDEVLNEKNQRFVNDAVAVCEGQKQDGAPRKHHSQGSDFTI